MSSFTFENHGVNTFLVYKLESNDEIDVTCLKMLTNNDIAGIAKTVYTQMDEDRYIKYNVSSKVQANQIFDGIVNKKRVLGLLRGIVDALISSEDYMIDQNSVIIDMNYIFSDVSTCETVLICLPIANRNSGIVDIKHFFKDLLFNSSFDQTENCDYVAKLMNYLNNSSIFSLEDFKKLIDGMSNNAPPVRGVRTPPRVNPTTPATSERKPVEPTKIVQPKPQPITSVPPQVPVSTPVKPEPAMPNKPMGPDVKIPTSVIPNVKIPGAPGKKLVPEEKNNVALEDKISLFYLLQHYNKENADAYKAQKEAKKSGASSKPEKAPKKSSKAKNSGNPNAINPGFSIPGQANPVMAPTKPQNSVAQPAMVQPGSSYAAPNSTTVASIPQPQPEIKSMPAYYPVSPKPQGGMNFGETTVLGGGAVAGETTVLSVDSVAQNAKPCPYLIRSNSREKIKLNKPRFKIGKERSYVDYFIGNNSAISRSHADIIVREDGCYIIDMNSTNHTYVNGEMVQSGTEYKLENGCTVCLANEEFNFFEA